MKKHKTFKPTREYIQAAVAEFQKNGGKIKKINFEVAVKEFKENGGKMRSYDGGVWAC
jgi:hypothetical protein